jgi:hypothetical protein
MRIRSLGIIALITGVLGFAPLAQADTGVIRVVIPGAFAAPSGTSADGQVTLQIGVGLPVFLATATGAPTGGSIASVTFAEWTDTVLTPDFGAVSFLMVFRLPGGLMVIAAAVATPNGFATSFSATPPYETLIGGWDIAFGPTTADALVTFTYDTNTHVKQTGLVRFVAGNALTSVVTKSIPTVASVDALRNIQVLGVSNDAKGGALGFMTGHTASNITGHTSEVVQLRAVRLQAANLYLVYGCAFPTPTSGLTCLVGGTGFATHLSGTVNEIAGMFRKSTITGVVDADLVLEMNLSSP